MWEFIFTDKNLVPRGEIRNASDRAVSLTLNKAALCSFSVRMDNPLAHDLANCDGYIKAYRNKNLKFFGPIVAAQEVGTPQGATVAINCMDASWYLTKRLIGKTAAGITFSTPIDRAQITEFLISIINSENETGIAIGSLDTLVLEAAGLGAYTGIGSSGSNITYTAGPYAVMMPVLQDLASGIDGFDWRVIPIDNFKNNTVISPKIGLLYMRPLIGVARPNAVFEWGGINGAGINNVVGYERAVTRESQANKVYHYTSNGPDVPGYPTKYATDASSIADWKLMEDVAQADLLNETMRQDLVDAHVAIRKQPRTTITFEPHIDPSNTGRLPVYDEDYGLGDFVQGRAVYGTDVRFDNLFRVWSVQFSIDSLGMEKATLTLSDDGS